MRLNFPFPSPYGVTVIKSYAEKYSQVISIPMFPSPYGVTVIKSKAEIVYKKNIYTFPSPYGVTVIKSTTESMSLQYSQ